MLRRVARALRALLFVLGSMSLVLVPANILFHARLWSPWPAGGIGVSLQDGTLLRLFVEYTEVRTVFQIRVAPRPVRDPVEFTDMLFPTYVGAEAPWFTHYASRPLWLLAAVCLAWPVTSYLVRRRRRGRGFEVEAAGVSAADPPDAAGGRG